LLATHLFLFSTARGAAGCTTLTARQAPQPSGLADFCWSLGAYTLGGKISGWSCCIRAGRQLPLPVKFAAVAKSSKNVFIAEDF